MPKTHKKYVKYEVSSLGRVKRNGELIDYSNVTGYRKFGRFWLHRAVAELFIHNSDSKPCIDHIDGNKTNNRVENLRWVTYSENMNNPNTKPQFIKSINKWHKEHPNARKGEKRSEETRKNISNSKKGKNTGPRSEETIKNMSEAQKRWNKEHPDAHKGKNNPMHGRRGRWMHNKINDQVYPSAEQIQYYLDKGYIFGNLKAYLKRNKSNTII